MTYCFLRSRNILKLQVPAGRFSRRGRHHHSPGRRGRGGGGPPVPGLQASKAVLTLPEPVAAPKIRRWASRGWTTPVHAADCLISTYIVAGDLLELYGRGPTARHAQASYYQTERRPVSAPEASSKVLRSNAPSLFYVISQVS